jgi:L-2-hydroxycarboxylate dehydrogenase (NAD+)
METPVILIDADALTAHVAELLHAAGVDVEDARFCAECLVQTSLWGKDSHGVMRVPHYMKRLGSGALNPRPTPQIVRGAGALEVMDADNGPGHLAGRDAMLRAISLAEIHNVGVVGVVKSNHFGAAAVFARLAAERDMVGIAMTNSVPKVIAPGGAKPITGSNPIAIAVPTHGDFPFLLDMSLSAVAGGRLLLAAQNGERIPTDWATDAQGQPTDDPAKAFAGLWLPMGGVKGLGLSYAVDILCGLITGGAFGLGMKSQYSNPTEPSGTGHMMIAINVAAIMDRDELRERMAEFCSAIKSSPMRDPSLEMLIPGERAHRTAEQRRSHGIPLSPDLYDELLALGAAFDVSTTLAPLPQRAFDEDGPA